MIGHVVHISDKTIETLNKYHWPGNVRELQNYAERAVVTAMGDEFEYDLLPDVVKGDRRRKISNVRAADLDWIGSRIDSAWCRKFIG